MNASRPAAALTALGLADLHAAYRAQTVDPVAVWQACRDRMDAVGARLGCVLTRTDALAVQQAQASAQRWRDGKPLGPLDGVPLGLKDNIDVAGWPCSAGTAAWRSRVPAAHASVWSRLADAGAILAGKLAMDEGALGAVTRNPVFGNCLNPLDPHLTPGGSSGGSAAAVAAGLCAAALGTDTLGSVRIPAAYCGLFGFKPSVGHVPTDGVVPLCESFDSVGPLARSGRDLAVLARSLLDAPPQGPPWSAIQDDPRPLGRPESAAAVDTESASVWEGRRIGVPSVVAEMPLQAPVRKALADLCDRLTASGARVSEVPVPQWEPASARRAALLLCELRGHEFWSQALGPQLPGLSESFAALLRYPLSLPAEKIERARAQVERVRTQAGAVFGEVELLLMPTTPHVAFATGDAAPPDQADLAALANLLGAPALAFPWHSQPLPVSFQWLAPAGQDLRLLGLAPHLDAWPEVAAIRSRRPVG